MDSYHGITTDTMYNGEIRFVVWADSQFYAIVHRIQIRHCGVANDFVRILYKGSWLDGITRAETVTSYGFPAAKVQLIYEDRSVIAPLHLVRLT